MIFFGKKNLFFFLLISHGFLFANPQDKPVSSINQDVKTTSVEKKESFLSTIMQRPRSVFAFLGVMFLGKKILDDKKNYELSKNLQEEIKQSLEGYDGFCEKVREMERKNDEACSQGLEKAKQTFAEVLEKMNKNLQDLESLPDDDARMAKMLKMVDVYQGYFDQIGNDFNNLFREVKAIEDRGGFLLYYVLPQVTSLRNYLKKLVEKKDLCLSARECENIKKICSNLEILFKYNFVSNELVQKTGDVYYNSARLGFNLSDRNLFSEAKAKSVIQNIIQKQDDLACCWKNFFDVFANSFCGKCFLQTENNDLINFLSDKASLFLSSAEFLPAIDFKNNCLFFRKKPWCDASCVSIVETYLNQVKQAIQEHQKKLLVRFVMEHGKSFDGNLFTLQEKCELLAWHENYHSSDFLALRRQLFDAVRNLIQKNREETTDASTILYELCKDNKLKSLVEILIKKDGDLDAVRILFSEKKLTMIQGCAAVNFGFAISGRKNFEEWTNQNMIRFTIERMAAWEIINRLIVFVLTQKNLLIPKEMDKSLAILIELYCDCTNGVGVGGTIAKIQKANASFFSRDHDLCWLQIATISLETLEELVLPSISEKNSSLELLSACYFLNLGHKEPKSLPALKAVLDAARKEPAQQNILKAVFTAEEKRVFFEWQTNYNFQENSELRKRLFGVMQDKIAEAIRAYQQKIAEDEQTGVSRKTEFDPGDVVETEEMMGLYNQLRDRCNYDKIMRILDVDDRFQKLSWKYGFEFEYLKNKPCTIHSASFCWKIYGVLVEFVQQEIVNNLIAAILTNEQISQIKQERIEDLFTMMISPDNRTKFWDQVPEIEKIPYSILMVLQKYLEVFLGGRFDNVHRHLQGLLARMDKLYSQAGRHPDPET